MMVLITYDVNTETPEGKKRLRQVAKVCQNYGQRVQHSVFECVIDGIILRKIQYQLEKIINKQTDSIRYYYMGENWKYKVEHIGVNHNFDIEGPLLF
ncbi:MAG TPA: CRISPR-associated endonuclease Cas2 [Termitinemataceae bacterium]|uniref:CRISPR-associated endonuclease Cas2 n=1 Tax=Treponema sp. J25 TaxID=2094121 RepID=UPI00104C9596|nr:CRISPR-associated endonuclease Cas2 [Treponema sp. J25]TCW62103.1 CRISPR-associated endonuclease Cas2 [Treponema sp. J25]HOJ99015.1 CRISPR-associated endonuclease Cas2 [Termitinemataceae bacterium]HOM23278.1 CRISPR-associated endonuclease Cas2 [Termitinemataceae bacterium]HPQ00175.1 CRISPR-associated endonuclease Cas2 [Termitinemataceae bacterium]